MQLYIYILCIPYKSTKLEYDIDINPLQQLFSAPKKKVAQAQRRNDVGIPIMEATDTDIEPVCMSP